jgi:hypothetical protein
MKITTFIVVSFCSALPVLAEPDLSKLPPPAKQQNVTYAKDIKPLFEASCVRCHSGDRAKAGLHLDSLEGALKGSKDGKVITPGKSEQSDLVVAVARLDQKTAMPPMRGAGRGPGAPGGGGSGGPGGQNSAKGSGNGGGGPAGPGAGAPGGQKGPPPKPLTPEQVGLVRAWIDQGAK